MEMIPTNRSISLTVYQKLARVKFSSRTTQGGETRVTASWGGQ